MTPKKDPDFFRKIGALGGRANVEKNGLGHMSAIGTKGGNSLLASRGVEFFSQIASLPDKKDRPGDA